jgi:serine/threonine-protein kinase
MGRLGQTYTFGGFRLDTNRRILSARESGETIAISTPVFDTLLHLIENAGALVERKALLAAVWPKVTVVENSVNQTISALRRALGDDANAPRYVSTESGRGYRFVAEVKPEGTATHSPEAYQLYAAGWSALTRPSGARLPQALELLNQAVACDPGFALAHAHLADAYALACIHGHLPAAEALPLLRQAADRAIEADPALSDAHVAQARVQALIHQDYRGALATVDRVIAADPLCFTAYRYKGVWLLHFAEFDQALAALRKAQMIQPLASYISVNIGMVLYCAGRYEEALAQFELTLRMAPDLEIARGYMGRTLLQLGQFERAIQELERGSQTLSGHPADLAVAWAKAGHKEQSRLALAKFLQDPRSHPANAARLYAVLGEDERAIDWLERCVETRAAGIFSVEPEYRHLHAHPRFRALIDRLGLRVLEKS